jgi:RecA/RadA recombinase
MGNNPISGGISVADLKARYLPLDILPLDTAIRGLPLGVITEISGWEGAGKSTLAAQIALKFLQAYDNGTVIYIDKESALNYERMETLNAAIGLDPAIWQDPHRLAVFTSQQLPTAQSVFSKILEVADAVHGGAGPTLVVLDSLAMCASADKLAKDDGVDIGSLARATADFIDRYMVMLHPDLTLLIVNQLRARIKINPFEPEIPTVESGKAPGGTAIKFAAFARIELVPSQKLTETYEGKKYDVGRQVVLKVIKHKGTLPSKIELFFEYLLGYEKWRNMVEFLVARGVLSRDSSGRVKLGDHNIYAKQLITDLRNGNTEYAALLEKLVQENRSRLVPRPLTLPIRPEAQDGEEFPGE